MAAQGAGPVQWLDNCSDLRRPNLCAGLLGSAGSQNNLFLCI